MKARPYFPLLAKVLGWLLLHLVILALAFVGFVGWQLELGLDSLLSGSAGERLEAFGDAALLKMRDTSPSEWNGAIAPLARERKVEAVVFDPKDLDGLPFDLPANVLERCKTAIPPLPRLLGPRGRSREGRVGAGGPQRDGPPLGEEMGENSPPPMGGPGERPDGGRREERVVQSQPAFLVRGEGGDGYWAGVRLELPRKSGQPGHPRLLLVRAERLDGSGMFFDFKPWLWGGLAVLMLSLAFWTPFVWGITRYVRRLTGAADRIAAGHFNVSLPPRGNDELGNLGQAIESMANRLDHLISGQKRFLGDAAHELCAPIARLRTGLGILEAKLADSERPNLEQIESEAVELANLVEEILAFSKTGNREPRLELIALEPFILEAAGREGGSLSLEIDMPAGLTAVADGLLLGRAIRNVVRNSMIHAGPNPIVTIRAISSPGHVDLVLSDNGPGVPREELPKLFEPFYRPDLSRTRDTGGSGLGLAIVRTAIEACGGEAFAGVPAKGGFAVTIRLRKKVAGVVSQG